MVQRAQEEKNHHNIEQNQELLARESISRPALAGRYDSRRTKTLYQLPGRASS